MRCAVLGDPIAHSLSPVLHRAGYDACGLDWKYDAHRVPSGGLADFLAGLDASWRGLSLTMPLKREALALASTVSDRAQMAGAANTVVLAGPGGFADNTDIPGAVAALRERYDGPVTSATVLGGGATATSLGIALLELGARDLQVLVRSEARAAETLAVLRSHPAGAEVMVGDLAGDPVSGAVVASTIPAQAQDAGLLERCSRAAVLFEALYHPWPTPFAASAGERPLVGGLDLLVHQAALQFELFTGQEPPVAAMRAAGEAALGKQPDGG